MLLDLPTFIQRVRFREEDDSSFKAADFSRPRLPPPRPTTAQHLPWGHRLARHVPMLSAAARSNRHHRRLTQSESPSAPTSPPASAAALNGYHQSVPGLPRLPTKFYCSPPGCGDQPVHTIVSSEPPTLHSQPISPPQPATLSHRQRTPVSNNSRCSSTCDQISHQTCPTGFPDRQPQLCPAFTRQPGQWPSPSLRILGVPVAVSSSPIVTVPNNPGELRPTWCCPGVLHLWRERRAVGQKGKRIITDGHVQINYFR
ncbi:hypothetical protein NL676_032966 [Syzygium grande]|nr:hypothetical protein NL676_032966 [Syzygium grande]